MGRLNSSSASTSTSPPPRTCGYRWTPATTSGSSRCVKPSVEHLFQCVALRVVACFGLRQKPQVVRERVIHAPTFADVSRNSVMKPPTTVLGDRRMHAHTHARGRLKNQKPDVRSVCLPFSRGHRSNLKPLAPLNHVSYARPPRSRPCTRVEPTKTEGSLMIG